MIYNIENNRYRLPGCGAAMHRTTAIAPATVGSPQGRVLTPPLRLIAEEPGHRELVGAMGAACRSQR